MKSVETSELIEKLLTENTKEELLAAVKILERMSYEEIQGMSKIAKEIDETTNH